MKNKKMVKVVSLMAMATTCVVSGSFVLNTKTVTAENEDVFHELGASVRVSEDKGLRFGFGLPESKTGDNYTIGTLVIPKSELGDAELNHNDDTTDSVSVEYEDIECSKNWVPPEELNGLAKDGYNYYNAALIDIPEIYYNTVVVARSYYVENGVYHYSDIVERSMGYVAAAALNDGYEDTNSILKGIVKEGFGETALSVGIAEDLISVDEPANVTANNDKGYLPVWSSSNETVATVDKTGKITPVRGGETKITATIGEKTAEKTVYVLGDGLYSDQIGLRINGWNFSSNEDYFSIEDNDGEMKVTTKFIADSTYHAGLIFKNLYNKAYYEALVANGYTKLTFNLKVEGNVTGLYVFGKELTSFPEKDGVYAVSIDVQHIVNQYANMSTIATSASQAGQAGSLGAKFLAWKTTSEENKSEREFVFTISNAEYKAPSLTMNFAENCKEIVEVDGTTKLLATTNMPGDVVWSSSDNSIATVENGVVTGVKGGEVTITATIAGVSASKTIYVVGDGLYSDQIGMRVYGNLTVDTNYFNMVASDNAMEITAKFAADATYSPALIFKNLYNKAYYQALVANGYTKLTFNLAVEGELSELYIFGKAVSTFPEKDGVYAVSVDVQHIVNQYENISKIATSGNQVGQASSLSAKFISWVSPANDWSSQRNYVFTISDTAFMATPTVDVNVVDTEIVVGKTTTVTATTDWDASYVVWSSSDNTIATVDNNGVVTGLKSGEVTITATVAGVSASKTIYVKAPTINVEGGDAVITVDGTTTLTATTDGNASDMVWSSSNDQVATVDNGVVTGVKGGEVTITATIAGVSASKTIYVVGDGLYSDQIGLRLNGWNFSSNEDYFSIEDNDGEMKVTTKFIADSTYHAGLIFKNLYNKAYYEALVANGYTKLTFNLKVEGNVTGLYVFGKELTSFPEKDGVYAVSIDVQHIVNQYTNMFTIATSGSQAGQAGSLGAKFLAWKTTSEENKSERNYVFTISNAAFMTETTLEVSTDKSELAYGETANITAETNWDASYVVWSSSDNTIATVDNNGVVTVTGDKWGEVTITATLAGVSKEVTITVKAPVQLNVEFADGSQDFIAVNDTTTLTATTDWNADKVEWTSSNDQVATVDNGVVTGVKGGEVKITATLGDLTASKTIYVVGDGLYSNQIGIRINGNDVTGQKAWIENETGENGEMIITSTFQANVTYSPALIFKNLYSKAYYEKLIASGYTKLTFNLTVDGELSELYVFGKAVSTFPEKDGVYAVSVDVQHIVDQYTNISIIATSGNAAGSSSSLGAKFISWVSPAGDWSSQRKYVFTISNAAFMTTPTVDVNVADTEIVVGKTTTVTADTDWDASYVVWSSSDNTIATVDNNGVVTGLKSGEVTITATIAGISASKTIIVKAPTISVNFADGSQDFIAVNDRTTLTATTDGNASDVVWSSSDNTIAMVDNGVVTALKGGEVTITATIAGVSASRMIYVVGDSLYENNLGVIAGAWDQTSKVEFFDMVVGENGDMTVTTKFKADQWRWPAIVLRNLCSKTYYEKLIDNGYTKWTFNLAVGGANAANVSDLYIFGTKLSTFPEENGVYAIALDVQYIVDNYDTIGVLGVGQLEAVPSKYFSQMLIAWRCQDGTDYTTNRNYVFTISNAEFKVAPAQLDVEFAEGSKDIVEVGKTTTLLATSDWDTSFVAWTSSDNTIATVKNGVVTGVKGGIVTITATIGDFTIENTIYVVGGLNDNNFGVIAGAWNQPSYITVTTDDNGTMNLATLFKGDQWRWPAVVLRNLESKAYYEELIEDGYTKLTFNLAVGGDNAADVSDLYIFGVLLSTFPQTNGVYSIAVNVQDIVNNYDTIGVLGTSIEAVPSKYHAQMLISWKCSSSNYSTNRNYVFTISNTGFAKGVLFADDIGMRVNGYDAMTKEDYKSCMTMSYGSNGEIIIGAKWTAYQNYGPALYLKVKDKSYYTDLQAQGYTYLSFDLKVGGADADKLDDIHILGSAQKVSACEYEEVNGVKVYKVKIQLAHIVQFHSTMVTLATSSSQAGQWGSRSALLLAWRFSTNFATVPAQATRNYIFTISNTAYTQA